MPENLTGTVAVLDEIIDPISQQVRTTNRAFAAVVQRMMGVEREVIEQKKRIDKYDRYYADIMLRLERLEKFTADSLSNMRLAIKETNATIIQLAENRPAPRSGEGTSTPALAARAKASSEAGKNGSRPQAAPPARTPGSVRSGNAPQKTAEPNTAKPELEISEAPKPRRSWL